jgi:hypothetical protein
MKKFTLIMLAAIFAFALIPAVSIYSHQAAAQPPEYNEITVTGDEDPETTLTVRIPKSVPGDETFDILATVSCEEREEYDRLLSGYIWGIGYLAAAEVKDYDEWTKEYMEGNEETVDAVTEALEEMDPEEIEEAFESEKPIRVHTATGTRYVVFYNWSDRLARVTSASQILTLSLLAPGGPKVCFVTVYLRNLDEGEDNVRIENIPIRVLE